MTADSPTDPETRHRSFIRGGVWQTLLTLMLFVVFFPAGKIFLPYLLLALLGVVIYGYIRGAYYFGKRTGITAVTLLVAVTAITSVVQFRAWQAHSQFVQSLAPFDTVTVNTHSVLPTAPIRQVTLKESVDDAQLEVLISMPQLQEVRSVYLEYCDVTDTGLLLLDRWPGLEYVVVRSHVISDAAIIELEDRHPDCVVIPIGRDF